MMSQQSFANIVNSVIAGLLLLSIAGTVKAYGEIEGLKARVEHLGKTIENVNTKIGEAPLCRLR